MIPEERSSLLKFVRDEVFYDRGYARILIRHYRDKVDAEREWGMTHLNVFGNNAAIIAITPTNELVLERVFRITLNDWVIELPGGCNDKEGESPVAVALRELQEETGYAVEATTLVATIADAPGVTDQCTELYLGTGARKVSEPVLEDSEVIETMLVPLIDAFTYLKNAPEKCDPKVWAALAFIQQNNFVTQ